MKTIYPKPLAAIAISTLVGAASLCGQGFTTDPVGAVNHTVPSGVSFAEVYFQKAVIHQGTIDNVSGTTVTMTLPTEVVTSINAGPHYIHAIDGAAEGHLSTVMSASTSGVELDVAIPGLASGDMITIRGHFLLDDLRANSEFDDGTTATVYNTDGTVEAFEYFTGGTLGLPGGLWADESFNDASNVIIYPGEGIVINNPGSEKTVTFIGSVSTDPVVVNVGPNFSIVGSMSPVDGPTVSEIYSDLPIGSTLTVYQNIGGGFGSTESYEIFDKADLGLGTGKIFVDSGFESGDADPITSGNPIVITPSSSQAIALPAAYTE